MNAVSAEQGRGEGRIAGVILAAGASKRMLEASKLLLPYGSTTVLGAVVNAALQAGLHPVVVVCGTNERPEVDQAVAALAGVRVVVNPWTGGGSAASLASGLAALDRLDVEGAAILLGDEPGVSAATVREVVRGWRAMDVPAGRAVYRDRPGHPVVVARELFNRLSPATGGGDTVSPGVAGESALGPRPLSAAAVLRRACGGEMAAVRIDRDGPRDIDTTADYTRAVSELTQGQPPAHAESAGSPPDGAEPLESPDP